MKDYSEKLVSFSQVSPTFFIGLGGSGSDVVNRIASKLKSRWNWHTLENLIHFFAVDTNTHDLVKQESVPRDNRILISDFDKRAFMNQKRGQGHEDEDEFVTQWVHDWYQFRGTRGAGAGQIRIESRLSLYYQLEQDRGKIIQRLNSAMNTARHHDNPYRKNHPPHFNVFIYGSVAGGTGSGSFLPFAYLVREVIASQGWIPKIFGTLIMPSMFLNEVPGALHPDINANGYAALKELEHLMKLGAEGTSDREAFHYNPQRRHEPEVQDKPYDFVYVADKPTAFEISEYKNAIADAAYLLLYSPILGAQASDYDNYEKHQKGLVSGSTVYYGSNGCSVLILPDKDILHYCSMRYAAKAMEDYLLFKTGDTSDFEINFNDPKFKRLSKTAQGEEIDRKFVSFIEYMARREKDDEIENGPYQDVSTLRTPTGSDLLTEFDAVVDAFAQEISERVSLHTLTSTDIVESNIKVDAEVNDLRNEVNESRSAIRGVWDAVRQDIKTGRVIGDFFTKHTVTPYAQRFFLIRMKERLRTAIDALEDQVSGIQDACDLGADHTSSELKDWREKLVETAPLTFKEKYIKKANEDFNYARNGFLEWYNGTLVDGNRALIVNEFKRDYLRETLDQFELRLKSFREVAVQATGAISTLIEQCEESRATGRFSDGDGQSNAYILDVEALQEVGGERLWDLFFEDRFVANGRELNYFDESEIFAVITEAFNPKVNETGSRVSKTSKEITDEIRDRLKALGAERLGPEIVGTREGGGDLGQRGLLLHDALFYEARYHFIKQYRRDGSTQEPSHEQLEGYIKSKFRFCDSKAKPLANFHEINDSRVIQSEVSLLGMHSAYRERLGHMADEVLPHGQSIPNWFDEKAMVFYHANLGIPLFFYRRVNDEMKACYERVMSKAPEERGYPLHVDANWEDSLPNLDPNEVKAAERKESERDDRLNYALGFATGIFRAEGDGRVYWHIGKFDDQLGDDRLSAFKALSKLDERTKRRIDARLDELRKELAQGSNSSALQQIDAYMQDLDELIWETEQEATSRELLAFLKREEELLKTWRQSLAG